MTTRNGRRTDVKDAMSPERLKDAEEVLILRCHNYVRSKTPEMWKESHDSAVSYSQAMAVQRIKEQVRAEQKSGK